MRLLFAEDDHQLRGSVSRGLREASWAVDEAVTGPEALALEAAHDYDVVVLDILLPEQDGKSVCEAVRARGSGVPILMLTALDGVAQRIAGLDAGADDYLTKPFDFGELLARLRALTRRRGDVLPSELTVGDLVIDTGRHSASRAGRELVLTAKEYALLVYLARNQGRVVSRAELMAHVWDENQSAFSNVIDVYVSRLRRKVDAEGVPMLSTLRGTGFMLDAADPGGPARAVRPRVSRRRK